VLWQIMVRRGLPAHYMAFFTVYYAPVLDNILPRVPDADWKIFCSIFPGLAQYIIPRLRSERFYAALRNDFDGLYLKTRGGVSNVETFYGRHIDQNDAHARYLHAPGPSSRRRLNTTELNYQFDQIAERRRRGQGTSPHRIVLRNYYRTQPHRAGSQPKPSRHTGLKRDRSAPKPTATYRHYKTLLELDNATERAALYSDLQEIIDPIDTTWELEYNGYYVCPTLPDDVRPDPTVPQVYQARHDALSWTLAEVAIRPEEAIEYTE
jgi:hypothetical protein